MSDHTNKQFDAEMERIRSGVLSMGGIVEQQLTRAIDALEKDDDARRTDAVGTGRDDQATEVGMERACHLPPTLSRPKGLVWKGLSSVDGAS